MTAKYVSNLDIADLTRSIKRLESDPNAHDNKNQQYWLSLYKAELDLRNREAEAALLDVDEPLEPLRELKPWMQAKIERGLGTSAQDGNGYYFLDFQTLRYYSPYDDDLLFEYERELEYVKNGCVRSDLQFKCEIVSTCLEDYWVDAYENYLADKELLDVGS